MSDGEATNGPWAPPTSPSTSGVGDAGTRADDRSNDHRGLPDDPSARRRGNFIIVPFAGRRVLTGASAPAPRPTAAIPPGGITSGDPTVPFRPWRQPAGSPPATAEDAPVIDLTASAVPSSPPLDIVTAHPDARPWDAVDTRSPSASSFPLFQTVDPTSWPPPGVDQRFPPPEPPAWVPLAADSLLPPPPSSSTTRSDAPWSRSTSSSLIDSNPLSPPLPPVLATPSTPPATDEAGQWGPPPKPPSTDPDPTVAPRRRLSFGHRPSAARQPALRAAGHDPIVLRHGGGLAGLGARNISAWFGTHLVLDRVSLEMPAGAVTSLIGPSGCGKSTFLRILNRMHEMIPSATLAGEVLLDGQDIYDPRRKITEARRQIGMVFQKPNPFPAMSIYDNVLAGLKLTGTHVDQDSRDRLVEECLTKGGLWKEVRDRLREPGGALSGGQQQRLCIARALAIRPRVLLMDEPCSALDPTSTRRIEETIAELAAEVTIVIVTHNMQQAARVSNVCAFFLAEQGQPGFIVEHGPTQAMFASPQDRRTADYVSGRFG